MKRLLLFLLLASTQAFALKEYYSISRSIRSLGMGGAYYTLSDDEDALFYNPAGLALNRREGELMWKLKAQFSPQLVSALKTITDGKNSGVSSLVDKLTKYAGNPLYGNIGLNFPLPYYVRKKFAISLFLADTKFDVAVLGKDIDTSVDVTMLTDSGLAFGFGDQFFAEGLYLGLTGKFVFRGGGRKAFSVVDIAQNKKFDLEPKTLGGMGGGVDFDLGAIYELPWFPIGTLTRVSFTLNNILSSPLNLVKIDNTSPPGLNRYFSLGGYTVFPGFGPFENFHALFDLAEFRLGGQGNQEFGARNGSFFKHVNMGVEAPMWGRLIPRLGFHQGYLTAGVGVDLTVLKLDAAYYAEEVSNGVGRIPSHRFAFQARFGFGSTPPPPVLSREKAPEGPKEEVTIPQDEKKEKPAGEDSMTVPPEEPVKPQTEDQKVEPVKEQEPGETKVPEEKAKEPETKSRKPKSEEAGESETSEPTPEAKPQGVPEANRTRYWRPNMKIRGR